MLLALDQEQPTFQRLTGKKIKCVESDNHRFCKLLYLAFGGYF